MIEEKRKTHTFQDQKSENDRLQISGGGQLDYLNEEEEARKKELREQVLKTPFVRDEFAKSYYRTAETVYACKAKKPEFDKVKRKILIFQPVIFVLLITETLIACLAPNYFSAGVIFNLAYIIFASLFYASICFTKYHMGKEELANHTIMKSEENRLGLIQLTPKLKAMYWINLLILIAGCIVDILNIGFNINVVSLEMLVIQVILVAAIFIIFTFMTFNIKDLYSGYKIVIGHGEVRETLPDKDTVYDFDEDMIYSRKDYFLINKELAEYNIGK